MIDWKRMAEEESEETIRLYIEEIKLEIQMYEQCIKQRENEIERAELFTKLQLKE